MLIESLRLTNFRCFGPEGCEVRLEPSLTALIGGNGSGKTAAMQALLRIFGNQDQRRVRSGDFHVPANEKLTDANARRFELNAILAFPELQGAAEDHSSVPPFFKHLLGDANGLLKCRVQLEATWSNNGRDGDIDDNCWALRQLEGVPTEGRRRLSNVDRSQIQVVYVPAARDASDQVSALLRGRLWGAIKWTQETKDTLDSASGDLRKAVEAEGGVAAIQSHLGTRWSEVHGEHPPMRPAFNPIESDFQKFAKEVGVVLRPDETGRERSTDEMSDGERSIFHLALTAATIDVETSTEDETRKHFDFEDTAFPSLTLLAIEEPENNLAPYYLSRIVDQVHDLTKRTKVQALVSSHSAGVLARIEPNQVRHFRLEPGRRCSSVQEVDLPTNSDEAAKYVREAVRAYPELYFASYVILGEGSSEEVVLPRLSAALGLSVDRSFVAIVPLGGRHVNHLWRLLKALGIPFATLLDLDRGRPGGGFGRIKTTVDQLIADDIPEGLFDSEGEPLTPESLEAAQKATGGDAGLLAKWIQRLETFSVFFCDPLDLDMTMLTHFPHLYEQPWPGGSGPADTGNPMDVVVGEGGADRGADTQLPYLWYRYLFFGERGKPTTHTRRLSAADDVTLRNGCPEVINRLLRAAESGIETAMAERNR